MKGGVIPNELKERIIETILKDKNGLTEINLSKELTEKIRSLSSKGRLNKVLDRALQKAADRFMQEYPYKDLAEKILAVLDFWQNPEISKAIIEVISNPFSYDHNDKNKLDIRFQNLLSPQWDNQQVQSAMVYFLKLVTEQVWSIPEARDIRDIYSIQLQRLSTEALQEQVALMKSSMQANTLFDVELRTILIQIINAKEQKLLNAPTIPSRPYNNLPRPDFAQFVGREVELQLLHSFLASTHRIWRILVNGIGGVGKTALALAVAHEYIKNYNQLPTEERFEAIIWVSAKQVVFTTEGKQDIYFPGFTFRTLEDIYTTIAEVLNREEITRALNEEEQSRKVQKALKEQRTLLIIDNLETVTDSRVKLFLRNLPEPTKVIITARDWLEGFDVISLKAMPSGDADKLITEEAKTRFITLDPKQRQILFTLTSGLPLPIKLSLGRMYGKENFETVSRWLKNAVGDLAQYCIKGQCDLAKKRNPDAWKLLLVCSLFDRNDGVSKETLAEISELSTIECDEALPELQRLTLVNQSNQGRFWLLPIVQDYLRDQFRVKEEEEPNGFEAKARGNWLELYTQLCANVGTCWNDLTKLDQLDQDYNTIYAALEWCFSKQLHRRVADIATGASYYFYVRGYWSRRYFLNLMRIKAAKALSNILEEAEATEYIVYTLISKADIEGANQFISRLRELHQSQLDSPRLVYNLHNALCIYWLNQGNLIEAEKAMLTCLNFSEHYTDRQVVILNYQLADILYRKGSSDEAFELSETAIKKAFDINYTRGVIKISILLAKIYLDRKEYDNARSCLEECEKLALSYKIWENLAAIYYTYARLFQLTKNPPSARIALLQAKELFERLGMKRELAEVELQIKDDRILIRPTEFSNSPQAINIRGQAQSRFAKKYGTPFSKKVIEKTEVSHYMDIQFPKTMQQGVIALLEINLILNSQAASLRVGNSKTQKQKSNLEEELVVIISASSGLELLEKAITTITLAPDRDSDPIAFRIKGKEIGEQKVSIVFWQSGKFAQSLELIIIITKSDVFAVAQTI